MGEEEEEECLGLSLREDLGEVTTLRIVEARVEPVGELLAGFVCCLESSMIPVTEEEEEEVVGEVVDEEEEEDVNDDVDVLVSPPLFFSPPAPLLPPLLSLVWFHLPVLGFSFLALVLELEFMVFSAE
jgi:hypothetical protein